MDWENQQVHEEGGQPLEQQQQQQLDVVDFRQIVEQYVSLCDTEKARKADLKDIRTRKTELSGRIIDRMNHMSVDSCRLPRERGRVVLKTHTREPTLTAKELNQLILDNAPRLQEVANQKRMEKEVKVITSLTHRS